MRGKGFSLVEVMLATVSLVVGLLSVVGTTTTTSMLRKRGIEEDRIFTGLVNRAEWVRGQLFADTALQNQCDEGIGGGEVVVTFMLDDDANGIQDLPAAPGDIATPVISCSIQPAEPFDDALRLVRVRLTASWYGVGGQRTMSIECLVGNRNGYKPG